MSVFFRKSFIFVGLLCAALPSFSGEITNVRILTEQGGDIPGSKSVSQRGMDKFGPRDLPVGREVVEVTWNPGSQAVPAGSELVLEYVREQEDLVRRSAQKIALDTRGSRVSRFEISKDRARFAGPVVSWRVQLVENGRVTADKRTAGWR